MFCKKAAHAQKGDDVDGLSSETLPQDIAAPIVNFWKTSQQPESTSLAFRLVQCLASILQVVPKIN
jgi:hypothetical protein